MHHIHIFPKLSAGGSWTDFCCLPKFCEQDTSFRFGKANPYSPTLWTKLIVLGLTEKGWGLWLCERQSVLWTKKESLEGTDSCQLSNF